MSSYPLGLPPSCPDYCGNAGGGTGGGTANPDGRREPDYAGTIRSDARATKYVLLRSQLAGALSLKDHYGLQTLADYQ